MACTVSSVIFFGYPIPDCCSNSEDADRLFGYDLERMSNDELTVELLSLQNVMYMGKVRGVTCPPKVNTPDGNPRSFYVWARWRIGAIQHILSNGIA